MIKKDNNEYSLNNKLINIIIVILWSIGILATIISLITFIKKRDLVLLICLPIYLLGIIFNAWFLSKEKK